MVATKSRRSGHKARLQVTEQEALTAEVLEFGGVDGHTTPSVLIVVVPIADMRVCMGNRFVPMRMRVPIGRICSHPARLSVGMLVGMVRVLVAKVVEVIVLMSYLIPWAPSLAHFFFISIRFLDKFRTIASVKRKTQAIAVEHFINAL